jgi:hypothetical protein
LPKKISGRRRLTGTDGMRGLADKPAVRGLDADAQDAVEQRVLREDDVVAEVHGWFVDPVEKRRR